jgi:hypothetical protein
MARIDLKGKPSLSAAALWFLVAPQLLPTCSVLPLDIPGVATYPSLARLGRSIPIMSADDKVAIVYSFASRMLSDTRELEADVAAALNRDFLELYGPI